MVSCWFNVMCTLLGRENFSFCGYFLQQQGMHVDVAGRWGWRGLLWRGDLVFLSKVTFFQWKCLFFKAWIHSFNGGRDAWVDWSHVFVTVFWSSGGRSRQGAIFVICSHFFEHTFTINYCTLFPEYFKFVNSYHLFAWVHTWNEEIKWSEVKWSAFVSEM